MTSIEECGEHRAATAAATDYSQAKIYRLQCDDGHFYIGSTVLKLSTRFGQHRRAIENDAHNSKVYRYIRSIGGIEHVHIELVAENLGIASRDELLKIEDAHIREGMKDRQHCLNRNKPRATEEERIAREVMNRKMWSKINLDIYRERGNTAGGGKSIADRVREYHRTHKLPKIRTVKSKDEIVGCECGWDLPRYRLAGHRKTVDHRNELLRWSILKGILEAAWKRRL